MVVLDTCAIIEACKNKSSLSKNTVKKISEGAYLLSISFAKIACKIKLGKLEMGLSANALYDVYKQVENLQIIDISVDEWLHSIDLDWPENRDPADRMIVFFAIKQHLPIVTSDKKIKQFYKKVIW
jgi:PIN domain nuclease of toxin-antitoxin system